MELWTNSYLSQKVAIKQEFTNRKAIKIVSILNKSYKKYSHKMTGIQLKKMKIEKILASTRFY